MVFSKPLLDVFGRGGLGVGCLFFWRVKQIVEDYMFLVIWSQWKWCHMSKKTKICPTLFFPHTFLSIPSVSTTELNFFGSIKLGKGTHFFGSEEICNSAVETRDMREYTLCFDRTQKNLRRKIFCVTCVWGCHSRCSTCCGNSLLLLNFQYLLSLPRP